MNARTVTLGSIAKITSGGTPDRKNPAYWGGTVPWVKTTLVQNCEICIEDIDEHITDIGLKNSSAKLIPAGSILMAMVGQGKTRGQVAILTTDAAINQNCAAIILGDGVSGKYVYQQLLFRYEEIRNASNSSGQQNLNSGLIRELRMPLPPLPQQNGIADVLFGWDTAIQKTERLIAAKERLYSHELSRLIGRSNSTHAKVGLANEQVSKNAAGERMTTLGELLTECRDPDIDHDPAKRLTVRLHLQGVEPRSVRGTESDGSTSYFRRSAGQLIYGKQNIFRGAIGIIPPELDGYSSTQDLPAFSIAKDVDPQWLYFWLSRKSLYSSLEALAAGSGSKRLHPEELYKVRILLPTLKFQSATARYLDSLRREIDLLKQLVTTLKAQKRGLMQKLLTGEWRLPSL